MNQTPTNKSSPLICYYHRFHRVDLMNQAAIYK